MPVVLATAFIAQPKPSEALIGGRHVKDFGEVQADTPLEASFRIRNDSSEVETLSGFKDACGVRASVTGNPILLPSQETTLILKVRSSLLGGSSGAGFKLHRSREGRKHQSEFLLTWRVPGEPWITKNEIWLKPGDKDASETIRLVSGDPDARLTIAQAPAHFAASVTDSTSVEIKARKGNSLLPREQLHLKCLSNSGSQSYIVNLNYLPSSRVGLFPTKVLLPNGVQSTSVEILNQSPSDLKLSSSPNITVRGPVDQRIIIERVKGRSGPAWIRATSGKEVAISEIFVEAAS